MGRKGPLLLCAALAVGAASSAPPARAEENGYPHPSEFVGLWTGAQTCTSGSDKVTIRVKKGKGGGSYLVDYTASGRTARDRKPRKTRGRLTLQPDRRSKRRFLARVLLDPKNLFRLKTLPVTLEMRDRGRMRAEAQLEQLRTVAEFRGDGAADALRVKLSYTTLARMLTQRDRCEGTLHRKLKPARTKKPPPEPSPERPRSAPDFPD